MLDHFLRHLRKLHELERPEGNWTLLIQSVLEGKAQEASAALEREQSKDYDMVRKTVLAAYEVVPQAYRPKFRSLCWRPGETYLDVARQQGITFYRRIAPCEVFTSETCVISSCLSSSDQVFYRILSLTK